MVLQRVDEEVAKLRHEGAFRGEALGLEEVQQAEELLHSVLQWGARQEDLVFLQSAATGLKVSALKHSY